MAKELRYDWTEAQLEERYCEDNIRKVLY
jgi:hypothetical protein